MKDRTNKVHSSYINQNTSSGSKQIQRSMTIGGTSEFLKQQQIQQTSGSFGSSYNFSSPQNALQSSPDKQLITSSSTIGNSSNAENKATNNIPNFKKRQSTDRSKNGSAGGQAQKPPRNPSKGPVNKNGIAPIDHDRQRQKLQELINQLMTNEDEENKGVDYAQLYESLNPSKKSLIPLQNGGVRRKSQNEKERQNIPNLPALQRQSTQSSGIKIKQQQTSVVKNEKLFNIKNSKKLAIKRDISSAQSTEQVVTQQDGEIKQRIRKRSALRSQKSNNSSSKNQASTTQYTTSLDERDADSQQTDRIKRDNTESKTIKNTFDLPEEDEKINECNDAINLNYEEKRLELEKELEVRDKFQLFSYGLRLKDCMQRRKYFLEAVNDLKRRFSLILYIWRERKAEQNFKELALLIETYDKDEPQPKKKLLGKLSKKRNIKLKKTPTLQTVEEREEELEVTTMKDQNEESHDDQSVNAQSFNAENEDDEREQQEENNPHQEEEKGQADKEEEEEDEDQIDKDIQILKQLLLDEISDELAETIMEKVQMSQLITLSWSIEKVKSFLKMVIHKLRYRQMRLKVIKLQSFFRMKKQQKIFKELLIESQKPKQIIDFTKHYQTEVQSDFSTSLQNSAAPQKRMMSKQEAVFMIERNWIVFRERDEGRKLREYLKGIPYECRRSYIKYYDLKFKTIRLKTDVDTFARKLPF